VPEQLGIVGTHDHRRTIHRAAQPVDLRAARLDEVRGVRRHPLRRSLRVVRVLVRRVTGDAMVLEAGRAALLVRHQRVQGRCRDVESDVAVNVAIFFFE
jgi:hypothetical protein